MKMREKSQKAEASMLKKSILFTVIFLISCSSSLAFRNLKPGQIIDQISIKDISGNPVCVNSSNEHQTTIVAFWASWSPESKRMLLDLQDVHSLFGPNDVRIIAINIDHFRSLNEAERDAFKEYAKEKGISYEIAFDDNFDLFNKWGVVAVPSSLYINSEGKIINTISGYSPVSSSLFIREIVSEIKSRELNIDNDGLIVIPEKELADHLSNSFSYL